MSDTQKSMQIDALLPGDVLLHMGKGELSKLIAWVGDGLYSHAAMVVDRTQLIEAAASGVRHAGLSERAGMGAHFHFIDVFRPLRPTPANPKEISAMLEAVNVYLGRPYPMTSLFTLGVACAARNKIDWDRKIRPLIAMALDLVIGNDSSQVVCSELVYRGFDEARTKPPNALRLEVITRPVQGTSFPKIDVAALVAESLDDYNRSRPGSRGPARLSAGREDKDDTGELADLVAQARAHLGVNESRKKLPGGYAPNPKTVLPADLEFSPGLRQVGRLAIHA